MIWVDYCILGLTLISIIVGIARGFTKEVFGIVTWIAAIIIAWLFGEYVADLLKIKIANPALSTAAGYAVTFLGGLIIGAVISAFVVEIIRNSRFASADRTIGGGFGLLRAVLLTAIFVMVAGNMGAKSENWWNQSMLISRITWLADGLEIFVPVSWLQKIQPENPTQTDQPLKAKPER